MLNRGCVDLGELYSSVLFDINYSTVRGDSKILIQLCAKLNSFSYKVRKCSTHLLQLIRLLH